MNSIHPYRNVSHANPSTPSPKRIPSILRKQALAALSTSAGLFLMTSGETVAATSTWQGTTDGTWATSTNWNNGTPGTTSGVTSTDIAVFNTSPTQKNVTIDVNRNIGGITFDTGVGSMIIGTTSGNALYLSAGGIIQNTSTVTVSETINAPIILEGNATLASNVASSSGNGMIFGGSISAASGVNSTLTLGGVNIGANNKINGIISDGLGAVAVTISSGKWLLGGNNTFTGALTISSGASAVISGSNSNQGGTILNGGMVLIQNNFAFGTATRSITVTANSTLSNQDGNNAHTIANNISLTSGTLTSNENLTSNLTFSGTLSGAGGLVKSGSGALILTSSNSYSGNTTLQDGYLQLGNDHALGSGTLVFAPATNKYPTLQSSDATTRTIANALSFTGASNKVFAFGAAGTGDLIFTNTNTTALPTSGTFQIVNNVTFAAAFSAGSLTKMGTGTMILTGISTYTGNTTVSTGELKVDGSLAAGSAVSVGSGATLSGSGAVQGTVGVNGGTIKGAGLNLGATTLQGESTISGTTTASSITVSSGTSTFSGRTTSNGGLSVAAGARLNTSGTTSANSISVSSGAVLNNTGRLVGPLSVTGLLSGNGTVDGALTVETSGTIAQGTGNGTTTITGKLTVKDSAKVSAQLNGLSAGSGYDQIVVTDTGSISLESGSILNLVFRDGLSLSTNDHFVLIDNQTTGKISGAFSSVLISDAEVAINSNNTFSYNGLIYELSYTGTAGADGIGNDLILAVVPEPSTWTMVAGGIASLCFIQGLRRRSGHEG